MSAIDATAAVLDEHLVREMDALGWWCTCGDEMRRDDPSRHVAEALQAAGLLRADA